MPTCRYDVSSFKDAVQEQLQMCSAGSNDDASGSSNQSSAGGEWDGHGLATPNPVTQGEGQQQQSMCTRTAIMDALYPSAPVVKSAQATTWDSAVPTLLPNASTTAVAERSTCMPDAPVRSGIFSAPSTQAAAPVTATAQATTAAPNLSAQDAALTAAVAARNALPLHLAQSLALASFSPQHSSAGSGAASATGPLTQQRQLLQHLQPQLAASSTNTSFSVGLAAPMSAFSSFSTASAVIQPPAIPQGTSFMAPSFMLNPPTAGQCQSLLHLLNLNGRGSAPALQSNTAAPSNQLPLYATTGPAGASWVATATTPGAPSHCFPNVNGAAIYHQAQTQPTGIPGLWWPNSNTAVHAQPSFPTQASPSSVPPGGLQACAPLLTSSPIVPLPLPDQGLQPVHPIGRGASSLTTLCQPAPSSTNGGSGGASQDEAQDSDDLQELLSLCLPA